MNKVETISYGGQSKTENEKSKSKLNLIQRTSYCGRFPPKAQEKTATWNHPHLVESWSTLCRKSSVSENNRSVAVSVTDDAHERTLWIALDKYIHRLLQPLLCACRTKVKNGRRARLFLYNEPCVWEIKLFFFINSNRRGVKVWLLGNEKNR